MPFGGVRGDAPPPIAETADGVIAAGTGATGRGIRRWHVRRRGAAIP
jgi:hypothetical protein